MNTTRNAAQERAAVSSAPEFSTLLTTALALDLSFTRVFLVKPPALAVGNRHPSY